MRCPNCGVIIIRKHNEGTTEITVENIRELTPAMIEAVKRLDEGLGWHGSGQHDDEIYYCEHCGAEHEDYHNIEHDDDCMVLAFKVAFANILKEPSEFYKRVAGSIEEGCSDEQENRNE